MKILRVALENLASMSGVHVVDFTTEPLKSTGLFSIVGPTGAGKSTLLDAICLALYSDTPRLKQAGAEKLDGLTSKDPRNLLRRGKGSGWAEVVFQGHGQQICTARWSVRRARNSATGNLQTVDMVLYSGVVDPGQDGVVLAGGKLTEVKNEIVQRIGLTFEQFTRAVLLAQNEFAAFLKADDNARAEILQTLTGTDQFERISAAVYEKARTARDSVADLEHKLQSGMPLGEEERQQAETALADAESELESLGKERGQFEKCQAWFDEQERLSKRLEDARNAQVEAVRQQQEAEPRRIRMEQAQRILREAGPLLADKEKATASLGARRTVWVERDEALKKIAEQLSQAEQRLEKVEVELRQHGEQSKIHEKTLRAARGLEADLKVRDAERATASERVVELQHDMDVRQLEGQQDSKRQSELERDLKDILDQLDPLKNLCDSADNFQLWLDQFQSLEKVRVQIEQTKDDLDELGKDLKKTEGTLDRLETEKLNHTDQIAGVGQQLETIEQSIQELESDDIEERTIESERQLKQYEELLSAIEVRAETERKIETWRAKRDRLIGEIEESEVTYERVDKELPLTEARLRETRSLKEQITHAIDDAASRLRANLESEQPCPVCGSLKHPWSHSSDTPDNAALDAASQRERELEQDVKRLQREGDGARDRKKLQEEQRQECDENLELLSARIEELIWPDLPGSEEVLAQPKDAQAKFCQDRIHGLNEDLDKLRDDRADVIRLRKEKDRLQVDVNDAAKLLREHDRDINGLNNRRTQLEEKMRGKRMTLEEQEGRASQHARQLAPLWEIAPEWQQQFEQVDGTFIGTIEDTFERCRELMSNRTTVQAELNPLAAKISQFRIDTAKLEKVWNSAVCDFESAKSSWQKIHDEHQELLGGKDAETFALEIRENEERLTGERDDARDARTQFQQELTAVETKRDEAAEELAKAESDATSKNQKMTQWYKDFSSGQDDALTMEQVVEIHERGDHWMIEERNQLEELQDAVKNAEGQKQAQAKNLEDHLGSRDFELSKTEVSEKLDVLAERLSVASEKTDLARAIILDDDNKIARQGEQGRELERLREETAPLLKLNEMIGSQKGEKFRRLAQQLTLDILLRDANYQLNQLTTRYRMERITDSLNLMVVDLEMGEERRSVHSLSGGETFLVSLSLALGLASLASNRLRIESLFIDEGFGTLDEETLRVATNALMHLEAQGRKVGVITHVSEMKDAIPVQIAVRRRGRGTSVIEVPRLV